MQQDDQPEDPMAQIEREAREAEAANAPPEPHPEVDRLMERIRAATRSPDYATELPAALEEARHFAVSFDHSIRDRIDDLLVELVDQINHAHD